MDFDHLQDWKPLLEAEFSKDYWHNLQEQVARSRESGCVYPPAGQVFRGFSLTPPKQVRVVILGQDPYHGKGQANGLAFSVTDSQPLPPSLRNIFQEITNEYGACPVHGDLTFWAKQGVLLLNPVLTVAEGQPNSHKNFGWQTFTDQVIEKISQLPHPIAFVLWGATAQKKAKLAQDSPYPRLILTAPHPSPLSAYRGFYGSKPFSQINYFLKSQDETPIQWV